MSEAHAAVKHELLVRHLDAWTPAALHRGRRATYVEVDTTGRDAAVTAKRVFREFADLLDRHTLTMLLVRFDEAQVADVVAALDESPTPPGLAVRPVVGLDAIEPALGDGPVFAWLDWTAPDSAPAPPDDVVSTVAGLKASELLLAVPPDLEPAIGLPFTASVDLVDRSRAAERLVFATSSAKALERFKDELWALDEYAGIRYRDPGDADGTLLDISLQPHLGPLRKALIGHLARSGAVRVSSLREWAVRETVYRGADATRAVQNLVASGVLVRTPASGRLSPDTLVDRLAS